MTMHPQIEAQIRFLSTEEGGRETPVRSGYRGQFHYKGEEEGWDAVQEYTGKEWVAPGETVSARLVFVSEKPHCKKLVENLPFQIQEGNRVVGLGVVIKVLESLSLDENEGYKAT